MSDYSPNATERLLVAALAWVRANYPGQHIRSVKVELDNGRLVDLPVCFRPFAPAADPVEPAPPGRAAPVGPSHSPDYRSCTVRGEDYSFSPAQATVVRQLWEAWEDGTPDIGQDTLLEAADLETGRLRDLFRPGGELHPAWGALIGPGQSRGTFRLLLG